jgi:hypothetical protein
VFLRPGQNKLECIFLRGKFYLRLSDELDYSASLKRLAPIHISIHKTPLVKKSGRHKRSSLLFEIVGDE